MSSETPKNSSRKKTLLTSRRTICKAAGLAGGALLVSTAKASSPHEPASPLSQNTKTVASSSSSMSLPAIPARMAAGDADSAPRSMYRLDSPAQRHSSSLSGRKDLLKSRIGERAFLKTFMLRTCLLRVKPIPHKMLQISGNH